MYRTIYNEKEKIWHGLKARPLYNPKLTIGEALLKTMQIYKSKIAQISDDTGVQLTFDQIRERTIRAAVNLQKRGYKEKEVFTIIARNSEHLAPIVFAAFCIGCPINPLDTSFGENEIKHMLSVTNPALILCDADVHERVAGCLHELSSNAKIITFNGKVSGSEQVEDLLKETGAESSFTPTLLDGPNTIAAIMCSSGTTGLPKGVSLSHTGLLSTQVDSPFLQSQDVLISFSQLYWITGTGTLILGTLYGATRIITVENFSPEIIFRLIPKYKITCALNAVYQLVTMLKHDAIEHTDLSSVKTYCVAGSRLPFGALTEFNKHFPNGETYNLMGMTETCGIYCYARMKTSNENTVGQLRPNIEVKIVDSCGNRCGINKDGEVCLKLKHRFLGYYNNEEATIEAFDEEGFFVTGDIGHFDENGYLFIVDRKKDVLKYNNYQITPAEIEAVLGRVSDIVSSCVVGVPDNDGLDLPAVACIRRKGSNISAEQIQDTVANNLADQYKLRGGVYFMDNFPTTASGKVLRRKVKEMLTSLRQATA